MYTHTCMHLETYGNTCTVYNVYQPIHATLKHEVILEEHIQLTDMQLENTLHFTHMCIWTTHYATHTPLENTLQNIHSYALGKYIRKIDKRQNKEGEK